MKTQATDRTGMLIVRLWIEPNHERGLRARITQTLDATAIEHSIAVAASVDDICAVVKLWVEDFAASVPGDGAGPVSGDGIARGEDGNRL